MSSRATPPHLKGYKPLYKGSRFWVFQNDPDNPYEGWTGEWNILVYHRPSENASVRTRPLCIVINYA